MHVRVPRGPLLATLVGVGFILTGIPGLGLDNASRAAGLIDIAIGVALLVAALAAIRARSRGPAS